MKAFIRWTSGYFILKGVGFGWVCSNNSSFGELRRTWWMEHSVLLICLRGSSLSFPFTHKAALIKLETHSWKACSYFSDKRNTNEQWTLSHPRLHLRYAMGTFVSEVPAVIMAEWKCQSVQFFIAANEPCRETLNCKKAFTGSHASYFWPYVRNKPASLAHMKLNTQAILKWKKKNTH